MLILQASDAPKMDLERARFNMVEQQIRPWEVLDQAVLDALYVVRREDFVPEAHRALAFSDLEIPLGDGETMMQPKIEARILQEVAVKPTDKVREIGTGSGYLTALLAHRARHVVSVEINPRLKAFGEANLRRAAMNNVTVAQGDGARGRGRAGRARSTRRRTPSGTAPRPATRTSSSNTTATAGACSSPNRSSAGRTGSSSSRASCRSCRRGRRSARPVRTSSCASRG